MNPLGSCATIGHQCLGAYTQPDGGKLCVNALAVDTTSNARNRELVRIARKEGLGHRILRKNHDMFVKKEFLPEELARVMSVYGDGDLWIDIDDPDVRLVREQMVLKLRADIEREQKSAKKIIRFQHNNHQVLLRDEITSRGFECITEQNHVDLLVNQTYLGEMKIEPDKGEYAKAFGQLMFAQLATGKKNKFVISINRKTPKTVVKLFTLAEVSTFSKINGVVLADNRIAGHEELHAALGVAA